MQIQPLKTPIWKRILALGYDLFIIACLFLMTTLLLVIVLKKSIPPYAFWYQCLLLIIAALYHFFFWYKGNQTVGMKAWKLILVDSSYSKALTFKALCLRLFYAHLSIACLGLGFFWLFLDGEKRTLYDRLSGTRIVPLP